MEKYLTLDEAKKKYGTIENGRLYGVHKAFDIYINDNPHTVYSISGYEHELGKSNGSPAQWWLDYSTEVNPERELVPYIDRNVHRVCWEIHYKQKNTSRHKGGGWRISGSGYCKIFANGKHVYSMSGSDIGSILSNAHTMTEKLLSHPYDFINPENDNGRKIYYYGLPATVRVGSSVGEIWIYPEYTDIPEKDWWRLYSERKYPVDINAYSKETMEIEKNDDNYDRSNATINHGDAFWDGMINWFRK